MTDQVQVGAYCPPQYQKLTSEEYGDFKQSLQALGNRVSESSSAGESSELDNLISKVLTYIAKWRGQGVTQEDHDTLLALYRVAIDQRDATEKEKMKFALWVQELQSKKQ